MSWRVSLLIISVIFLCFILSFWLGGLVLGINRLRSNTKTAQIATVSDRAEVSAENIASPAAILKTVEYEEYSPDHKQKSIEYKMDFAEQLYSGYYEDYYENQMIISIKDDETKKEKYVFVGDDRTGYPHWLGNDHIIFTTYCGTSCQGLYLLDVRDKELKLGVVSYLFVNGYWVTHFHDWFNEELVFGGLLDEVRSAMDGSLPLLIFRMKDDEGEFIGDRKMLFTGKALKSV